MDPLGFLHVFRLYSHLSPLFPNYKTISDVMSNRHGTRIAQNLGPRTQLTSNKNTNSATRTQLVGHLQCCRLARGHSQCSCPGHLSMVQLRFRGCMRCTACRVFGRFRMV